MRDSFSEPHDTAVAGWVMRWNNCGNRRVLDCRCVGDETALLFELCREEVDHICQFIDLQA